MREWAAVPVRVCVSCEGGLIEGIVLVAAPMQHADELLVFAVRGAVGLVCLLLGEGLDGVELSFHCCDLLFYLGCLAGVALHFFVAVISISSVDRRLGSYLLLQALDCLLGVLL